MPRDGGISGVYSPSLNRIMQSDSSQSCWLWVCSSGVSARIVRLLVGTWFIGTWFIGTWFIGIRCMGMSGRVKQAKVRSAWPPATRGFTATIKGAVVRRRRARANMSDLLDKLATETLHNADLHWMRRAIGLATANVLTGAGGPFGAVIVQDGQLLAEGANEVAATCDPTAHAEVVAIRRACQALGSFRLTGCTVYCSCEPCPMCLAAIYWAHIGAICHGSTAEDAAAAGFDDARFYRELAADPGRRAIPCRSMLRDEAAASFAAWAASPLSVAY